MIRFKYVYKENFKRIGSGILITTLIGSSSFSLSGCGEKKETVPNVGYVAETVTNIEIDRKNYAVYLENNIGPTAQSIAKTKTILPITIHLVLFLDDLSILFYSPLIK